MIISNITLPFDCSTLTEGQRSLICFYCKDCYKCELAPEKLIIHVGNDGAVYEVCKTDHVKSSDTDQ